MKLSSKSALIIAVAVLVVAALALAAFLVYPKWQELQDLDTQIQTAQAEIDQSKTLLEQRQAVKAQATQTDAELLRLTNQLPESPELPSFIIQLQDTANEAGVEFVALTPEDPVQNSGYSAVPLTLQINGAWADIIDYLQRISKMTRQVRIVGYTASPASAESATSSIQKTSVAVDIEVYTLAPTQTSGGTPPPPPAQ